jgi:hypothetical protein
MLLELLETKTGPPPAPLPTSVTVPAWLKGAFKKQPIIRSEAAESFLIVADLGFWIIISVI